MFFKCFCKNYLNNISKNRASKYTILNQRKYTKIRHLQQAGFTLIELMVAVTLTSFMALAISSVFIFSIEQFNILMQQHKTEEAMLFASYHIRSYLSQAINMQVVRPTPKCHLEPTDLVGNTDQGFIVEYNPACSSTVPSETALVALFPRENSFKYNSVDLFETSIFYERPDEDNPSRPGRLMFGLGTRTNGNTNFLHSPHSPHNIIYEGLSNFEMTFPDPLQDIKVVEDICNGSGCGISWMARTIRVTLRFRYFLFTEGSGGNFYDYFSDIREVNARELENTIDINFHNNTMAKCGEIGTGCDPNSPLATGTEKERIFGPIYFYKLILPAGLLNF